MSKIESTAVFKKFYSTFLNAGSDKSDQGGRLHFAAHSHHYWPDVTRDAMIQYWEDSAKYCDDKWEYLFDKIIPKAQSHIAHILNLSNPNNIAFATSTHELVMRLLSCFNPYDDLRILTTDSEFYSFARQADRLDELDTVVVDRIPIEPFHDFEKRFSEAISANGYHMIYLSHVFFNSGFRVRDLEDIVKCASNSDTIFVIDGYHGFMAIPTSLRNIENRVFYVAGGYKYAQSGEGVCFMTVPADCNLRPIDTGWFSNFGMLAKEPSEGGRVEYPNDGFRFWGGTYDPTGIYRFNSVMDLMKSNNISVETIDRHVKQLQKHFIENLSELNLSILSTKDLITPIDLTRAGHFLTFALPDAAKFVSSLKEKGVTVDFRGNRVRFGFGLYQDLDDVDRLLKIIRNLDLS